MAPGRDGPRKRIPVRHSIGTVGSCGQQLRVRYNPAIGVVNSHNRVARVVSALDVVSARRSRTLYGYCRGRSGAGLTAARAQSCASGARMSVSFPFYRVAVVSKKRSSPENSSIVRVNRTPSSPAESQIVMLAHRDIGRMRLRKGSGTNPIGRPAVERRMSASVWHHCSGRGDSQ